jgi:ubiquinone/menaquinone biosynthesis C-methylase UbiE
MKLLVSGCGAGSEMITAKQFGVGQVYGVEVEQFWIDICKQRLRYIPDMHPTYYDGESLPYTDAEFKVIASGHVIEHTRSPERYLRECMRVLAPGGYISLEFPNRYHHTELHMHLHSFEWLPRPVRNTIVRGLASPLSPLKKDAKRRYRDIVITNLQQISVGGISRMLKRIGQPFTILDSVRPLPGVTRCVIRKD